MEPTTSLAAMVAIVMVVIRVLERVIEWAISGNKTDKVHAMVEALYEMHLVKDSATGAPKWYVPSSLGDTLHDISLHQRDYAESQRTLIGILERMETMLGQEHLEHKKIIARLDTLDIVCHGAPKQ